MNTDCSKCKAPMPKLSTATPLGVMIITSYRCPKCGHWNNLKRRKLKP